MILSENKMVICFFKNYKHGYKHIFVNFIKFLTKGKYTHVEIWFPSSNESFSSSSHENKVRFTREIKFNKQDWVFYEVPSEEYWEPEVYERAKRIEGKKYYKKGIIDYFLFKKKEQDNDMFWSSKAVSWVLKWKNFKISPQKMADIIVKSGWKEI